MQPDHFTAYIGNSSYLPENQWNHIQSLDSGRVFAYSLPGGLTDINYPLELTLKPGNSQGYHREYRDNPQSCYLRISTNVSPATLQLETDRFGHIPVFYTEQNQSIYLSTSLANVLALLPSPPGIDQQAIYDYLFFHVIPAPRTIYNGISRLSNASSLKIDLATSNHHTSREWSPSFEESTSSQDELAEELMELLKASVKNNTNDNSASFLSGGLDSSTITGLMSKHTAAKDSFSIGFPVSRYDESEYAILAAKKFGCNLHQYSLTAKDIVDAVPYLASKMEQPFGNSSIIPTYYCAKIAQEHGFERMLAGDGGDELFAGNERYIKQRIFERFRKLPQPAQTILSKVVSLIPKNNISVINKAKSYIDQANVPLPDRLHTYNLLNNIGTDNLLNNDFLRCIDEQYPFLEQRSCYHQPDTNTVNRMLYLDWKYTLSDNDLVKVNQMCGIAGIEVVYPMLDDSLVDFSTKIPSELKIKNNELRYFYKYAMRNLLPEKIIHKKKHGFGLPYGYWLNQNNTLRDLTMDSISQLRKMDIFHPDIVDNILNLNNGEHSHYYGELAWILMSLGQWLEKNLQDSATYTFDLKENTCRNKTACNNP